MTRGRIAALAVGTTVAGAAVWIVTADLAMSARVWTLVLVALLPAAMLLQGTGTEQSIQSMPRRMVYISSAASLWALGITTLLVSRASGITPALIGLRPLDAASIFGWTCLSVAAALAALAAGRFAGMRESAVLRLIAPQSKRDRGLYIILCISAGIFEEITYRGFLMAALAVPLESMWAAAVVSSIAFGVLHAYQYTWGAVRAGILGLALAVPLVITGSLIPSMIAHTAIDLIAGLALKDWLITPVEEVPRA